MIMEMRMDDVNILVKGGGIKTMPVLASRADKKKWTVLEFSNQRCLCTVEAA